VASAESFWIGLASVWGVGFRGTQVITQLDDETEEEGRVTCAAFCSAPDSYRSPYVKSIRGICMMRPIDSERT
jgi:hypothetical protein